VKILLVEDNERVSQFVVKGLQEAGHTTDHAANGRDGMFLAASEPYDVIIMDRMLPGDIDGLAIVEVLRKTGKQTPILILSALSGVDDRIRGLRSGGDDYLTKPFAFGELLARIDALHRRSQGVDHGHPLTVGDLHMDPMTRKVTRGSRHIVLQPREFKLLEYLMRHAGQVVTRTMLLECLGLSFRSANQRGGRAHQQAAPEDRCGVREAAAAHRAQRRLFGERR
jgi:two-component system, OmpR family, response regulator